jgi:hypothetical protein
MTTMTAEIGNYKNITATGDVSTVPGSLIGFYVNSTSSGTIVLRDGGSGGTVMSGTITPAIGFHRFPSTYGASGLGLHATIGATINVTFFYQPAGSA